MEMKNPILLLLNMLTMYSAAKSVVLALHNSIK